VGEDPVKHGKGADGGHGTYANARIWVLLDLTLAEAARTSAQLQSSPAD